VGNRWSHGTLYKDSSVCVWALKKANVLVLPDIQSKCIFLMEFINEIRHFYINKIRSGNFSAHFTYKVRHGHINWREYSSLSKIDAHTNIPHLYKKNPSYLQL
jgi:hypothetical protein